MSFRCAVWEQGVEPGSCPPQGLKLFRTMISREALRSAPPTADTERADPPTEGNPVFFRPVPPFSWFKKWSGTSWTWGPQSGNRGWNIEELEDTDAWQGTTPVDSWNLRIGSVHVQCPRVITDANTGICRLAWLPDDETLLRTEAGVMVSIKVSARWLVLKPAIIRVLMLSLLECGIGSSTYGCGR